MECPVCYTSEPSCHLLCGHSFCNDCIKQWYIKCPDEINCPMCRGPMYFRGINKKIEEWEEEHRENLFQNVFEYLIEELLEDVNMTTMPLLKFISERLQKIRDYDMDLDEDDIDYFIFNDELEYYQTIPCFRDVFPWMKNLKISKHPSRIPKHIKGSFKRGYRDTPSDFVMYLIF